MVTEKFSEPLAASDLAIVCLLSEWSQLIHVSFVNLFKESCIYRRASRRLSVRGDFCLNGLHNPGEDLDAHSRRAASKFSCLFHRRFKSIRSAGESFMNCNLS